MTPQTDELMEQDKAAGLPIAPERWRNLAMNLEEALAEACQQLKERDELISKIRSYPYIPQGMAAMIDRETAKP